MRKLSLMLVLALVLGVFALPVFAQEEPTQTIAEIVVAATEGDEPQFTVLLAAVGAADPAFLETLSDPEARVTVFAPTDEAFTAAFEALDLSAEDVLANTDLLNAVLSYHVVPSAWTAESLLAITAEDATPIIGTFLPEQALVLSQDMDSLMVNDSTVVAADVAATNGIVHVIDSVLLPNLEAMAMMADMEMEEPTLSIAELVVASTEAETPEFTTLLAAVAAADPLVLEELTNGGPYTVFAPTDEAFAAALEALGVTAEDVLADQSLLTSILAYHVIPGTFSAATVVAAAGEEGFTTATLLGGTTLSIMVDGESVMVNDATVIAADIYATNGVIHVIDSVLLPPM
ncbi:MAG: fasciclin domain-containing protein [Chloroflexota bacterium]|nr:fasciclin domain-containing protein [Chloroflexota bacterium]